MYYCLLGEDFVLGRCYTLKIFSLLCSRFFSVFKSSLLNFGIQKEVCNTEHSQEVDDILVFGPLRSITIGENDSHWYDVAAASEM